MRAARTRDRYDNCHGAAMRKRLVNFFYWRGLGYGLREAWRLAGLTL